jgi:hypothetical protein
VKVVKHTETGEHAFRPSFTCLNHKCQKAAEKREQILKQNAERKSELQAKVESDREKRAPIGCRTRKVTRLIRKTTHMVGVIPLKSLKINGNENQGDQVAD